MCGIVGYYQTKGNMGCLKAMADAIVHRGPDDEGFFCERNIGLGMRR